MNPEIHWIEGPWSGRLAILARPRGGDWLEDEVRGWERADLNVVVSLLIPDEDAHFHLDNEGELSRAHGLRFVSFPIPDRAVPGSLAATSALVQDLERILANGKNVGVHCRQGIGRSALIAACVLVASDKEPSQAFELISVARGLPVPETDEQREWVKAFARELSAAVTRA
ncbi:MAG TPA: tyrosine protein phosphatase [Blastocatellia bacterium]|nr:tyrosine protein phosphatase [Blastocatellia bacterium]